MATASGNSKDIPAPILLRAVSDEHVAAPRTGAGIVVRSGRRVHVSTARDSAATTVAVQPDDVVKVVYDFDLDDGRPVVHWVRTDELLRERGRKTVTRSDGTAAWEIDFAPRLGVYRTDVEPVTDRGALGLGIKVLEFFGIEVTKGAARSIGETFERKQLGNEPGLYRATLAPALKLTRIPKTKPPFTPGRQVLLFLHGTMSSFAGSFKDLASTQPDAGGQAAQALRQQIGAHYGNDVYAWEHRSLSESPIQNALALVERLPVDTELHVVSHSRGGLIGELLCLGQRDPQNDPLRTRQIHELFAADHTVAEQLGLDVLDGDDAAKRDKAYDEDRTRLETLVKALEDKRIRVTRFVRVACPARGTTLASGRLDRWLSVLDLITPGGLFGDVFDFLLAVVKERTDPRTLPGIEAMMPGSALTRLLHLPDLVTSADLSAIAGDIEGEGLWAKLKLLALDWFYSADHDLVVNTGSMTGGITRTEGAARYNLHKNKDVNHFRYFRNKTSIDWLAAALARKEDTNAGFIPIGEAKVEEPRWRSAMRASRSITTPRPLAIVVPGTMGSALTVRDRHVWLRYWSLLKGGLGRLDIGAADVRAFDILDDFYGPLLEHLTRTHKVEICPYDWRRSVRDAARQLTDKLEAVLLEAERTRQPVHIVAHSMGGLVARAMIADTARGGAQAWRRMAAVPGSRLLMLGTPNRGSYEAVRWLTGFNPTQGKLALLDLTRGTNGVIELVRRFPGLVELLPFDDEPNPWARVATWRELKQNLRAGWSPVDENVLREAQTTWMLLRDGAIDPERMIYVAGCHPATVVEHEVVDDEYTYSRTRLQWIATSAGDGTVTWASGQLAGVPMYYAPETGHDQLCNNRRDRRIFRGYVDLLRTGKTDQLPAAPPTRRRAGAPADERFVLPDQPAFDDLPDEAAMSTFGFGGTRGRPGDAGAMAISAPIDVRVLHGDLAYVRHPVLVGHYEGDTIVSAEAALDTRLGGDDPQGPLSHRRDLGLYPGPLGTHEVFFNEHPSRKPDGALVVGLGRVGDLSPGRLESGVRDALLDYALRLLQRDVGRVREEDECERLSANVSALLVGTGANRLPLRDSLEAMLRGALAANRKLEDAELDQRVRIDCMEFVELYEDLAIGAATELAVLLESSDLGAQVMWRARCVEDGDGRHRRARFDADQGWWQRIEITEDRKADRLRFVVMADRARAEETLAFGQLRLADGFIAEACGSAEADSDLSKTLFEMLLPNRLKESAPDQRAMVLQLDEQSARFPWELLEDRWSQRGCPPAVAAGMIRQLKVLEYRAQPRHPVENTVYVVGNPSLEGWERFADLPGARREAEQVRNRLREHGFDVSHAIDQSTHAIVNGLYAKGWRILHLAGHGEHDFDVSDGPLTTAAEYFASATQPVTLPDGTLAMPLPQKRTLTGMVIGKGIFLTPGDVEQMRYVPEVVFINCCHLGKTGGVTARYNKLAANLGVQFIRMGVRAVVCAGWAVNDAAAVTFAETFYARLLDGDTFGEAVRAARYNTWLAHPGTNTWGAYQCYGDQGYRLVRDHGGKRSEKPVDFYAPAEFVAAMRNLVERTRMDAKEVGYDDEHLQRDLRTQIEALIARVPEPVRHAGRDAWLERADVCAAMGFAYGEGRLFSDAVEWLERALAAARGECPIKAVEQCANFNIRLAAQEWVDLRATLADGADDDSPEQRRRVQERREEIVARIERALAELDVINARASTAERLSLLGSACKRLAWVQTGRPRVEALLKMADYYRKAFEIDPGAYPFTNWAMASVLIGHLDRTLVAESLPTTLVRLRQQQAEETRARIEHKPDFWSECGLADLQVLELMMSADDAKRCAELAKSAAGQYAKAAARGASLREIASIHENLDFLREFIDAPDRPWPKPVRDALAVIRRIN